MLPLWGYTVEWFQCRSGTSNEMVRIDLPLQTGIPSEQVVLGSELSAVELGPPIRHIYPMAFCAALHDCPGR
jgi:hypothetical protein